MLGDDMPYKKRSIDFLDKIAKMCDDEATAIIKEAEKDNRFEAGIDAMVWTQEIMSINLMCQMKIEKMRNT